MLEAFLTHIRAPERVYICGATNIRVAIRAPHAHGTSASWCAYARFVFSHLSPADRLCLLALNERGTQIICESFKHINICSLGSIYCCHSLVFVRLRWNLTLDIFRGSRLCSNRQLIALEKPRNLGCYSPYSII